jgi:hypothetical protein
MKKLNSVLHLGSLTIPRKVEKARSIVIAMTGNANFPSPTPALDVINQQANDLEAAQLAAVDGSKQETADMHAKSRQLDLTLKSLAAYVEGIANANPKEAEVIILSAGMDVKQLRTRVREDFEVKSSDAPGEIRVGKRAESRAAYIIQMTATPEQETSWETVHAGTRGRFTKKGLRSATRYHFRVAVLDKQGQRPWSEVKSAVAI